MSTFCKIAKAEKPDYLDAGAPFAMHCRPDCGALSRAGQDTMMLWNRWRFGGKKVPSLNGLRFVLYTREGCHLCEEALGRLRAKQAEFGFALEIRDVDADPQWQREYGDWVPVVMCNDKLRFKGGMNPVLLDRLLR